MRDCGYIPLVNDILGSRYIPRVPTQYCVDRQTLFWCGAFWGSYWVLFRTPPSASKLRSTLARGYIASARLLVLDLYSPWPFLFHLHTYTCHFLFPRKLPFPYLVQVQHASWENRGTMDTTKSRRLAFFFQQLVDFRQLGLTREVIEVPTDQIVSLMWAELIVGRSHTWGISLVVQPDYWGI